MRAGSAPATRHGPVAQLLIAWSPLTVILLEYAVADWLGAGIDAAGGVGQNRLGFRLHVAGPADADRRLVGTSPSAWLQEHAAIGAVHWYDLVAALLYTTHFVMIPAVTGVVWFCFRDRFAAWLVAVLVLTTVGIGGYVVYPAAPPWLASRRGVVDGVRRISDRGWDYPHLAIVGRLVDAGQARSIPTAAMPSLHAGAALMIALFLWPVAPRAWRAALTTYALLMALTLVYTGEHYLVDVVAGWVTAVVAVLVAGLSRGRLLGRDRQAAVRGTGLHAHRDHRSLGQRRLGPAPPADPRR